MLAIVMLINRIGAMVLPFLGIYMTTTLGFSLNEAGFVLSCFGIGAVLGSVTGGWLTDRFGHFVVQSASLLSAVPVFLIMFYLKSLPALATGVFVLSLITEIFRPANSVAISHYAGPESITRSFSLNRMALNLGFSIGPALGGFFAAVSYHLLFYGNAFSSAVAGTVFYFYFRKKEKDRISADALRKNTGTQLPGRSPWQDRKFVVFSILGVFYSIFFLQLLTTLPLYYKEVYRLKDWDIGLLLAFNGLVVFTLEMFIVSTAERLLTIRKIIVLGSLFCASSFLVLIPGKHLLILYFGIFLLSLSEILTMPFMATVAVSRATRGKEGAYMGLNSLSFSSAHIISPIAGTVIATRYGFDILWEISGLVALLTAVGFWINLKQMAIQDKSLPALSIE